MKRSLSKKTILVTKTSMPDYMEFCEEIKSLWDSHWITNMGEKHQQLQRELENYLDCPHVVLYANGHLALESIIAAMQFPRGSEVITTPFTFASTTHAIVRNGLIPVFCDIKSNDYTIDTNKIEELITERTVAILPVHVYGNMCDVDQIEKIAHFYNLKVIYDAAHAFAVKYRGVSAVNFGDASMLSFHATKIYNTIEGGAACFRHSHHVPIMNDMKNFGIRGPERVVFSGGNAKMNEFQAAMGICNLRHVDQEIVKRKKVMEKYKCRLDGVPGIKLWEPQNNVKPNYAYCPVIFDDYGASRDEVAEKLSKYGIMARKYFFPLTNAFECYSSLPTAGADKTPVAKFVSERVLTLPLYADLAMDDVDFICDIVLSCGK